MASAIHVLAPGRVERGEEKNAGQQKEDERACAGPGPFRPVLDFGSVEIHVSTLRAEWRACTIELILL